MVKFKNWTERVNMTFPVPEEDFDRAFAQFCFDEGVIKTNYVGFMDGKLIYMHAKVSQKGYYHMPFKTSKDVRNALHERME